MNNTKEEKTKKTQQSPLRERALASVKISQTFKYFLWKVFAEKKGDLNLYP